VFVVSRVARWAHRKVLRSFSDWCKQTAAFELARKLLKTQCCVLIVGNDYEESRDGEMERFKGALVFGVRFIVPHGMDLI